MALRSIARRLPIDSIVGGFSLGPLGRPGDVPFNLRTLAEAGVIRPMRPDKLARVVLAVHHWGTSPAAGIAAGMITRPNAVAIQEESGESGGFSFRDLHERSNALARGLRDAGVAEGDGVAIMARNHHRFIEATLACSKLGANALYMNTGFAKRQFTEVVEREDPAALIYDDEFAEVLSDAREKAKCFVAWRTPGTPRADDPSLEELIEANDVSDLDGPGEPSRFVILTSGTTGAPKGAQRAQPDTLGPLAALFSKIPLRAQEPVMIAAPLFHSWGFAHFTLGLSLGSTYVLRRRFDPEQTLEAIAESKATTLVVVPVMMQRILELGDDVISKHDVSSLRVTAASGSALPGELATRWMDTFGDNLYNLYGSTEVAWATIATPEDLRAAPGTAGRPPRGTKVRIVDEDGKDIAAGKTGRVFVGNEMAFEGYTGGGTKEELDGLLSSGDVGHFDDDGRLFIDGRDDDMIVSGGENVFPREIEDLLADHDAVAEVAVIGVEDEQFGQRLKAFIVTREGSNMDADEVKSHVKSNLAGYKVPREVEFLDSLPRNATGKVLKRELA
jgi:fatty-acyl-CoA synthase